MKAFAATFRYSALDSFFSHSVSSGAWLHWSLLAIVFCGMFKEAQMHPKQSPITFRAGWFCFTSRTTGWEPDCWGKMRWMGNEYHTTHHVLRKILCRYCRYSVVLLDIPYLSLAEHVFDRHSRCKSAHDSLREAILELQDYSNKLESSKSWDKDLPSCDVQVYKCPWLLGFQSLQVGADSACFSNQQLTRAHP